MAKKSAIVKLVVFLALVAAAFLIAHRLGWFDQRRLLALASALRHGRDLPGAALLFAVLFGALTAVGLPSIPLILAGGAIFGTALGTLLSWVGTLIGAAGGYWLARTFGMDAVRRFLRRHRSLREVRELAGFLPLLRLHLLPVVPLSVLNFCAGAAKVDVRTYLAAAAIGLLPQIAVYSYFADSVLSHAVGAKEHAMRHLALACGLLLIVSFVPSVARKLIAGDGRGPHRERPPVEELPAGRRSFRSPAS